MAQGPTHLTPEGYEKLRKELEYMKTTKRRELSKAIGEARAHGDISENAEYDAAKEAQGLNEKRIAELDAKLASAQILDNAEISKDEVLIGATVKLKDMANGEELEYAIVAEEEADFAQNKISIQSPVGTGLLNHKKGDVVEIQVPRGVLRYKILSISR
ncbi:MAG: transcription elongation factor GreA [Candidatus Omnitrophica bacterium]|nr:transcription elongation factor GreA [Candidatus Omnitrophota bacterium]MDD5436429.1 transcription elongation factor GreA [Candidatus Omnitrophota bacterium]